MDPFQRDAYRARRAAATAKYRDAHREEVNEKSRIARREERKADPEKHRATRLAYDKANKVEIKARQRWYKAFGAPEKERQRNGMIFAPDQTIASMWEAQNGLCAIGGEILERGKFTHVDHCHKTGRVRALLCHHCNMGIGHFKDNTEKLSAAIKYLEQHAIINQVPTP